LQITQGLSVFFVRIKMGLLRRADMLSELDLPRGKESRMEGKVFWILNSGFWIRSDLKKYKLVRREPGWSQRLRLDRPKGRRFLEKGGKWFPSWW